MSCPDALIEAGDVIGCGVDFTEGSAFYTKSGEMLSTLLLLCNGIPS
jgi:hypothetical protein